MTNNYETLDERIYDGLNFAFNKLNKNMEIDIDNVKSIKFGETKEYDKLHNSVYRVIRIVRENGEEVDITLSGKEEDLIFKL